MNRRFEVIVDSGGARQKLIIKASSASQANMIASEHPAVLSGAVVVKIAKINEPIFSSLNRRFERVKSTDLIALIKQLSVMVGSAIPIIDALDSCIDELPNGALKRVFTSVRDDALAGNSLSRSLSQHTNKLGELVVAMFALGEQSGRMDDALKRLAQMLSEVRENRQKLVRAVRYPAMVLSAMMMAFGVVMVFVVPSFEGLFASFGGELPWATRVLLGVQYALNEYGIWAFGMLVAAFGVSYYARLKNALFRKWLGKMACKIWLVGGLIKVAAAHRFMLILGELIGAGLPIKRAFETALGVVGNSYLKERLSLIQSAIERGEGLKSAFERAGVFDKTSLAMIAAGEASGEIGAMIARISKYYKEHLDAVIDGLNAYLEPALMLFLGVMVALLGLGIFMPMWDLARVVG